MRTWAKYGLGTALPVVVLKKFPTALGVIVTATPPSKFRISTTAPTGGSARQKLASWSDGKSVPINLKLAPVRAFVGGP
jgi:hypothetical protein